jgi:signal transduction histidine kinase
MPFSQPPHRMDPGFDPATSGEISRELHRTAQPLTVLQGVLELALLSSHTTEEYRDIIQQALQQSLRISGCFDDVRALLHLQESRPDVTSFLPKTQPNPEPYETQRIECVNV